MKHRTDELDGRLLDVAVALALGMTTRIRGGDGLPVFKGAQVPDGIDLGVAREDDEFGDDFEPSRRWDHGGPLIEREKIELEYDGLTEDWRAVHPKHYSGKLTSFASAHGDTARIAAMRAFVKARLGEEIELP
jgi:hypothetical protein